MSTPYQPNDDPTLSSQFPSEGEPEDDSPYRPNNDPTIYSQIEPTAAYTEQRQPASPVWPPPAPEYPAAGYPVAPPRPVTPQPAAPVRVRRVHRWRWLACGIVIGVALLPCACFGAVAGYFIIQAGGSSAALTSFCSDLKAQNYTAAYTLLAPIYQVRYSRDQFVRESQTLDQQKGRVTACGKPVSNTKLINNAASYELAITRAQTVTVSGAVALAKSGSQWRIAALDPAFGYPA
jgi:hypothetical protein